MFVTFLVIHLDGSKACDPDFINPRLLKEGFKHIRMLSFLIAPSH